MLVGLTLIIFKIMQLIIHTANTKLSTKDKCIFIENTKVTRKISPKRVTSIAITTDCLLNASVIKLAANNQIPIYFFNNFGTLQARMTSPHMVNLAKLRKKQLKFYEDPMATEWMISLFRIKTSLQIRLLKQLIRRKVRLSAKINEKINSIERIEQSFNTYKNKKIYNVRESLMGLEGSISRIYFQSLALFMPEEFHFAKRSRKPALDYFNAGLNYLYGMTYSIVEDGIYAKGLDPYTGYLHTDSYGNPTLVYDLIEPVRPIIDRLLVELIFSNELNPTHFIKKEQGYWLHKTGKTIIIPSFNQYLYQQFKVGSNYFRLKKFIYDIANELRNFIDESITLNYK